MKNQIDDHAAALLAASLSQHPDYRVLRRLPEFVVGLPDPAFPYKGLVVDTEATGLDADTDQPIDVGMVLFSYDAHGRVGPILATYSGLQDPGIPLKPEIVALTGYTDDILAGHRFDITRIEHLLLQADVVIAHHAAYDRRMYERITPAAARRPWVCSAVDIAWRNRGFGSFKLEFLVYANGYFFDGHTALADCFATVSILAEPAKAAARFITPLGELIHALANPKVRVAATGSPYATKDALKERNYRWSDGSRYVKAWWKDVPTEEVDAEIEWLSTNVYGCDARTKAKIEPLSHFDRFSTRSL